MTAKEQNKLLSLFMIAQSGLQFFAILIIGFHFFVIGLIIDLVDGKSDNRQQVRSISIGLNILISLILCAPIFIGGWKLLKERRNAPTWGIIAGIFCSLNIPLGIAVAYLVFYDLLHLPGVSWGVIPNLLCFPSLPFGIVIGSYGVWFLRSEEGKKFYLKGWNLLASSVERK